MALNSLICADVPLRSCSLTHSHVMQRTVLPRPFCPSVCRSVCQTRKLWQNERNLCPHSYTTWKIIHPSFLTSRMVGGGDPFYLKNFGAN